ncbi:MAG TPA: DUF1616 domain-containing protein [Ktedonobacteraceae bacterium]
MRQKNLDLLVTMIIAVLNLVWALLPSHLPVVGIILTLPLVLVLPGYTLTEAMFHKRSLDASHRLIFSLGLSLAIAILSGLILNLLPIGLQTISWAVLLGLLTVIFSLLVAYLRREAPVKERHSLRFRFSASDGILSGLAIIVAGLSILYAANGVLRQPHPGFTQLWMLPQIQAGRSCAVRLGIHSFEATSTMYRITMMVNGARVNTLPQVTLSPQDEWNDLVPITPEATDKVYVEVQLYRADKPQVVYRKVDSTLHSCPTMRVTEINMPSSSWG